jgi:enoyl-CoA hydratase
VTAMTDDVAPEGVARIRLNRPEKRHALSGDHVEEIVQQIKDAQDAGIEIVLLESSGPIFCAGANRSDVGSDTGRRPAVDLLNAMLDSKLYWVAAVQGGVVGAGVSMLTLCHHVIATPATWFSLPEYNYGLLPTLALELVASVAGPRFAWHLASPGVRADAQAGLNAGLVSEIVSGESLNAAALKHAEAMAAFAGMPTAAAKWWRSKLPAEFAGADRFA